MLQKLHACRICGNTELIEVLDLGDQVLTGVFPRRRDQAITRGPLQLVKCTGSEDCCGLLQLAHSYDLGEMYGDNYGYRSGLNASMVTHLGEKVAGVLPYLTAKTSPVVLDIGSNDGTTLSAYPAGHCIRIGMDPTAAKFRQYYPADAIVVADFFSASKFLQASSGRRADVVTSFSMFYDLEKPMDFVQEIAQVLADDGIWVFEQSYLPTMLEKNSFDTVCHEHLEYYALKQVHWMLRRAGMKVLRVDFNAVNGGSFSVHAAMEHSPYPEFSGLEALLEQERSAGLDTLAPYQAFAKRTAHIRNTLRLFLAQAKKEGKRVAFLGASTKGNVLLQYCGFTQEDVVAVGEVNPDKFGVFTPGTLIPIIEETELMRREPDYLVVLPWHFRDFFLKRPRPPHGRLVFPLPDLEIVA